MTTRTFKGTHYTAPWGKLLYGMTALGTAVIGGAIVATFAAAPTAPSVLLAAFMGATLMICATGAVTGYRIEGKTLIIERLGRNKRVSLEGLTAIRHDNDVMRGALRVGNGGLFVFSGFYWNRREGWFRLHGNDILGRAVVLEVDGTKWVITPESPEAFVAEVKRVTK